MARFKISEPDIDDLDGLSGLKREICDRLTPESNVVEAEARSSVLFAGDLHGCFNCLKGAVKSANILKADRIVFLGDYVDRGPEQFETLECVLRLALDFPDCVTVLRGNHESVETNKVYGFRAVLTRKFNRDMFRAVELCRDIYEVLPLVFRAGKYIGLHGGVPSKGGYSDVFEIPKPHSKVEGLDDEKYSGMLDEILWNDPDEAVSRFGTGKRGGPSRSFGEKAAKEWLEDAGAEHLIRAHESSRGQYESLWDGLVIHLYTVGSYSIFGGQSDASYPVYGFKSKRGAFRIVDQEGTMIKSLIK